MKLRRYGFVVIPTYAFCVKGFFLYMMALVHGVSSLGEQPASTLYIFLKQEVQLRQPSWALYAH